MRTLIIGLGNPLLGDDGIGWRVAEAVQQHIASAGCLFSSLQLEIEVDCLAVGGLSLMERLIGYDRAILVDALNTGQNPAGAVSILQLGDLPDRACGHLGSAHDASLKTALSVGRSMGVSLPEQVAIVAIESPSVYDFSEDLSPPVMAALPEAVQVTLKLLRQA